MAVSASPVSRGVRARRTRVLVNHASQILVICAVTCALLRHQQFLSLTAGQMRILNNLRGGAGGSWYPALSIMKVVAEMLGQM